MISAVFTVCLLLCYTAQALPTRPGIDTTAPMQVASSYAVEELQYSTTIETSASRNPVSTDAPESYGTMRAEGSFQPKNVDPDSADTLTSQISDQISDSIKTMEPSKDEKDTTISIHETTKQVTESRPSGSETTVHSSTTEATEDTDKERMSEIERFIERLRTLQESSSNQHRDSSDVYGGKQVSVDIPVRTPHHDHKDTSQTAAVPQGGRIISIDEPVKISRTHTEEKNIKNQESIVDVLGQGPKEVSIDTPVEIHHQDTDSHQSENGKEEPQGGSELSIDVPVKIAHNTENAEKEVSIDEPVKFTHPVKNAEKEVSIDEPVKITHPDKNAEQEVSINIPVKTTHHAETYDLAAMKEKHRDLAAFIEKLQNFKGHSTNEGSYRTVASEKNYENGATKDNDNLISTKAASSASPVNTELSSELEGESAMLTSDEGDEESTKPVADERWFSKDGAIVVIILGAGAAGLLVLLLGLVLLVVCCCSEQARARRKQKKLMVLDKDLNRWDPQVLRPSKENIDAFIFGSPMPSVSEMLTKY